MATAIRRGIRLLAVGCVVLTASAGCRPDGPRYLALGDSYTIGESVAAAERWPVLLIEALRERGHPVGEPESIAGTGWTGAELGARLEQRRPVGPYAMVSLLIGVNDQFRGQTPAQFRPQMERLLRSAIALADGDPSRVFVVSIPDYGFTPFGTARRSAITDGIDAFNAVGLEVAARSGVAFVDITPISRSARPDWVAGDGLHPSGIQYRAWVEAIVPAAQRALTAP